MKLTVIGSNSAVPSTTRWTSSQFLLAGGKGILIDCGEGTQIRLQMFEIKLNAIDHVYISHLHGDHYFGLVGLISTFHLMGRTKPLTVFGPEHLDEIINMQLELSMTKLSYQLVFIVTDPNTPQVIYKDKKMEVSSIPLDHRIDTTGFLFKEMAHLPNINKQFIIDHDLSLEDINNIKNGGDYINVHGSVFKSKVITYNKFKPCSYAYISDTMYKPDIAELVSNVTLLYHETTFLSDRQDQAIDKFHSTAREAAMLAKSANAEQLLIGHFSKRYSDSDAFVEEAAPIFPNTTPAYDGLVIYF